MNEQQLFEFLMMCEIFTQFSSSLQNGSALLTHKIPAIVPQNSRFHHVVGMEIWCNRRSGSIPHMELAFTTRLRAFLARILTNRLLYCLLPWASSKEKNRSNSSILFDFEEFPFEFTNSSIHFVCAMRKLSVISIFPLSLPPTSSSV